MKENDSSGHRLTKRNSYRAIVSITLVLLIVPGPTVIDAKEKKSNIIVEASELAVDADFENAVIKPKKNNPQVDKLLMKMPSGENGNLPIQYQDGKLTDRSAKLISDPAQAGNQVLKFWLKSAEIPGYKKGSKKGRIQVNIPKLDEKAIVTQYRIYLHPDLKHYSTYPKVNAWFVITELWMGENWTNEHRYPFRISLGIAKDKGINKPLGFHVSATTDIYPGSSEKWEKSWGAANREFEVPIGEWLDVELGYRQGDAKSGRFYLTVKRDKDSEATTIFDFTNWTYSPYARKPVPLTTYQPLKIYTSEAIVNHIREKGGVAQIYYDDLKIWRVPK